MSVASVWKVKLAWQKYEKRIIATAIVLAVVWVAGCAVLYRIMRKPPEEFARFMAKLPGPVPFLLFPFETLWTQARAGTLHIGDQAPDFSLAKLDHTARVQLADFTAEHRPVVLVFGSYT
jgi:hypothetical protein